MDRQAVADRLHARRQAERELPDRIPVLEAQLEQLEQQNQAEEQRITDDRLVFEEQKVQMIQAIDEGHRRQLNELRNVREKAEEQLREATDDFRHNNSKISINTRASRRSRAHTRYVIADSRFKVRQLEVKIEKAEAVRQLIESFVLRRIE